MEIPWILKFYVFGGSMTDLFLLQPKALLLKGINARAHDYLFYK